MKRFIIVATVLMLSVVAFAQHEVGTLSIQPKAGLNIAYFTDAEGADPRFMWTAGAELEYQLWKKISLAGAVMYSKQGSKVLGRRVDLMGYRDITVTFKTDYINFPIIANFYIFKNLALKFGIQPAVNVKSCYSTSDYDGNSSLSGLGINFNTFDFSIPVGLSYEYRCLVLDARYNIGVTKLVDGDDSRNRVVQITAGIRLDL